MRALITGPKRPLELPDDVQRQPGQSDLPQLFRRIAQQDAEFVIQDDGYRGWTPEGLKVFPEDVEAVLDCSPGVRESAVIGRERVHAVLVLEPGVVPIRLRGMDRVLPRAGTWPHPGPVEVKIGAPVLAGERPYRDFARQVEDAVRAM